MIKQNNTTLTYTGVDESFLARFFALDENYENITTTLARDTLVKKCIHDYFGLRIMRQDPWQCLIGFLCSSASNIPRITNNIESIAQHFGRRIDHEGKTHYLFPNPGDINNEEKLAKCKLGFRQKYILTANTFVTDTWLSRLKRYSYAKAREKLMQIPGIAEKIADCVLLFSLGFHEAFPVDTHIKNIMERNYLHKTTPLKHIAEFGQTHFSPYAGYAQQFLYHAQRNSQ